MKQLIRGVLILASSTLFSPFAFSENDVERQLIELGQEIFDAQRDGDFGFVADKMAPYSLGYFRRVILAQVDRMEQRFSPEEVDTVIGIARSKLDQLTDKEFFEQICRSGWIINPEGIAGPVNRQFRPIGVLSEGDAFHYVLYRYETLVESDADSIRLGSANLLTFRRIDGDLKLWSLVLAAEVPRVWHRELAKTGEL